MSFNGSGTYSLPGAALNTGDTVSATENNTLRNDMATAFNKTLCRDGQATPTANLPMGGFKHTGLAAGTTAGDSVRFEQLPSGSNVLAEGSGGTGTTVGHNGFKNRIINGAMVIDQRNAGASVTQSNAVVYTVDRWYSFGTVASKFTIQQSTDAPTGFRNSAKITSSSAYSVGASEQFIFTQAIEGFNTGDFGFGAAGASNITLSFWVKSSLTGTFAGGVSNANTDRSYPFSYTISAANTWEQKSITIAGDTTGTWNTTNGVGLYVNLTMGAGSSFQGTVNTWNAANVKSVSGATSVVGTSGATFYITGVQLEKGSTATSFDYRPYGTELALCQRYYTKLQATTNFTSWGTGLVNTTSSVQGCVVRLPVTMRSTPTVTYLNMRAFCPAGTAAVFTSISTFCGPDTLSFDGGFGTSVMVVGQPATIQANNTTNAYIAGDAEL
jgi:hypothetical protein